MLDHSVIPIFTTLVAQNNAVFWHSLIGIGLFKEVAFLSALTQSGFCEVNMVDVGACRGLSRRILHRRSTHEKKQHKKQRKGAFQISSKF
jgi:hypothetical protein